MSPHWWRPHRRGRAVLPSGSVTQYVVLGLAALVGLPAYLAFPVWPILLARTVLRNEIAAAGSAPPFTSHVKGATEMKILFACLAADGHFNPLTGIAVHLARSGHDVRWYTGASMAEKLQRLGVPLLPFRRAVEITGENIPHPLPGACQAARSQADSASMAKRS